MTRPAMWLLVVIVIATACDKDKGGDKPDEAKGSSTTSPTSPTASTSGGDSPRKGTVSMASIVEGTIAKHGGASTSGPKSGTTQPDADTTKPGGTIGSTIASIGSSDIGITAGSDTTPTPTPTPGTTTAADELKVGDRVTAMWSNGRWYPGKIVAIKNGAYDVNFDDGDKGRGMPASKVKKRKSSTSTGGGTTTRRQPANDGPCPGPGLTRRCNGVCVNIQENSNHCGGCNNRCPSGKRCDGHMFCRDAAGNL
ncbi:MAG: hypothetical protein M3619_29510 [Myxococcota bacterium]|nr:hypothetical protein [Myxococcota bacterium]